MEYFVGGREKERVLVRSWDSIKAMRSLDVAGEEPGGFILDFLIRRAIWESYEEL